MSTERTKRRKEGHDCSSEDRRERGKESVAESPKAVGKPEPKVIELFLNMAPRVKKTNIRNGQWTLDTKNQGERAQSSTPSSPVVNNRTGRAVKVMEGSALVKMAKVVAEVGKLDQDMVNLLYKVLEPMSDSTVKRKLKLALPDLGSFQYKREEKSLGDPKWQICMLFKTESEGEDFLEELMNTKVTSDVKNLRQALDEIFITHGAFKAGKKGKKKSEEEKALEAMFPEVEEEEEEGAKIPAEEGKKEAEVEDAVPAAAAMKEGSPVAAMNNVTPTRSAKKLKLISLEDYSKDFMKDHPEASGAEILRGWNMLKQYMPKEE